MTRLILTTLKWRSLCIVLYKYSHAVVHCVYVWCL